MFSAKGERVGSPRARDRRHVAGPQKHTQWPGEGPNKGRKKGDPIFDAYYATQVETVLDANETQQRNKDAGAALLDKIGPAIVLTHSQSGTRRLINSRRRPQLVKGIVAIKPLGPPFEASGAGRTHMGPTDIPITYDPPVKDPSEISNRTRNQSRRARSVCLLDAESASAPVDQPQEHSGLATETILHLRPLHREIALNQAGVRDRIHPAQEKGIRGQWPHGHDEKNNLDIAKVIDDWAQKNVR